MKTHGTHALGRATFHSIAPRRNIRPTTRELRWLKHIERHGPQPSTHLYELTQNSHRCKDTCLRDMQKLRAGGFLMLPRQQRATERAEFKPYIYDLTKQARAHLEDHGLAEATVRPTGHWWHGLAVSRVTSSIDIAASRAGVRYIPAHMILELDGAEFAIPVGRSKLMPDQLFALDYGGGFRAFALEVDRGTEPKVSAAKRKSWARSIDQYCRLVERDGFRSHYGLKANILVLWVFTRPGLEQRFRDLAANYAGRLNKTLLTQTIEPEVHAPHWHLFEENWRMTEDRTMSIAIG